MSRGFIHIPLLVLLIGALVIGLLVLKSPSSKTPTNQQEAVLANDSSSSQPLNILVLKYYPIDSSGTKLDASISGNGDSLSYVQQWVDNQNKLALEKLTESTKYHGYKNPSAKPSIQYQILDTKEFLKPTPRKYWPRVNTWYSDYRKILTEDVDICKYVNNQDIKDVWIWSYQMDSFPQNGIFESNMSMGKQSKKYWNFSSYGDVSNDHYKLDDLPQCNKTYVVYNFNYHDYHGTGDMLHDYGHQIENEMKFADAALFLDKFTTRNAATYSGANSTKGCGDLHSPPNAPFGSSYDYKNTASVKSDCEDWNPDRSGTIQDVSCSNWFRDSACSDDGGYHFYQWWFQNLPGLNNGITYQGHKLRNWWEFMQDFDRALDKGKTLFDPSAKAASLDTLSTPPTSTSLPSPIAVPSPSPSPSPAPTPSISPQPSVSPTTTLLTQCLSAPSSTSDQVVQISWTNPLPYYVNYVEVRNTTDVYDWATSAAKFSTSTTSITAPNGFVGYEGKLLSIKPNISYKVTLQYTVGYNHIDTGTFTVPSCSGN